MAKARKKQSVKFRKPQSMTEIKMGLKSRGDYNQQEYFKFSSADKIIFRPVPDPNGQVFMTEYTHWVDAEGDGKNRPYTCMGKGCPICEITEEDDKGKTVKTYPPRREVVCNAVIRSGSKSETVVARVPNSIADAVSNAFDANPTILDPNKGQDFSVRSNGKTGKKRRYDSIIPTGRTKKSGHKKEELVDVESLRRKETSEEDLEKVAEALVE